MTEPEGFETSPERRREDKGAPRSMLPALIALAALVTIGAALGLAVGLGGGEGGEDGDGNVGAPPPTSTSPNEIPQSLVEEVCLAGGPAAISTLAGLQERGLLKALAEHASKLGDPECADAVLEIERAGNSASLEPFPFDVDDYDSCVQVVWLVPAPAVCQIIFPARSR